MLFTESKLVIENLHIQQERAFYLSDMTAVAAISNTLDEIVTEQFLEDEQWFGLISPDSSHYDLLELGFRPGEGRLYEALLYRGEFETQLLYPWSIRFTTESMSLTLVSITRS